MHILLLYIAYNHTSHTRPAFVTMPFLTNRNLMDLGVNLRVDSKFGSGFRSVIKFMGVDGFGVDGFRDCL